jgi:hypothetical protein
LAGASNAGIIPLEYRICRAFEQIGCHPVREKVGEGHTVDFGVQCRRIRHEIIQKFIVSPPEEMFQSLFGRRFETKLEWARIVVDKVYQWEEQEGLRRTSPMRVTGSVPKAAPARNQTSLFCLALISIGPPGLKIRPLPPLGA